MALCLVQLVLLKLAVGYSSAVDSGVASSERRVSTAADYVVSSSDRYTAQYETLIHLFDDLMARFDGQEVRLQKLETTVTDQANEIKIKSQKLVTLENSEAKIKNVLKDNAIRIGLLENEVRELKLGFTLDQENSVNVTNGSLEINSLPERPTTTEHGNIPEPITDSHTDDSMKDSPQQHTRSVTGTKRSQGKAAGRVADVLQTKSRAMSKRFDVHSISNVAFSLSLSRTTGHSTVYESQVLAYADVLLDIGNGYNTGTGIYTVPVSGVYVFTWSTTAGVNNVIDTLLMINSQVRGALNSDAGSVSLWNESTGLIIASVNQGDRVFVRVGKRAGGIVHVFDEAWTTFSGWRLF